VPKRFAAAAFAAAGLGLAWLAGRQDRPLLWLAAAFASFVVAMEFLRRTRRMNDSTPKVTIDDRGVVRTMSDGKVESVRWDQLAEVQIVTTDQGPFTDDVFWLLIGEDGEGCAVPSEAPAAKELLERLQELSGFDNEAVIKAMGSTSNARFHVWKRGPVTP
jgi:hypothetical protein